jgi:hypothetical protein
MPFNFNAWMGQVTTGHGCMILAPTFLAVAEGTMGWQTAIPLLFAGTIGLLWPENTALKAAAQATATDVEGLIAAYRTGLAHAAASNAPPTPPSAAPLSHSAATAAALALTVAAGLGLAACTNQTTAQKAATSQAIASGLLCVADASGKVVATATTNDPDAVKAVNAAVAAGSTLTTDAACQAAIASGTAALPAAGTATP